MSFMAENCDYQQSEIRSVLAALGFLQTDIKKELAVLSGGERFFHLIKEAHPI